MDIQKIIDEYIELKEDVKAKEKRLSALETIILDEKPESDRITIVKGRQSIVIKPETYERLNSVGVETEVVETRLKKIDEFDIDTRKVILANPDNITIKETKSWVKIKKAKENE